MIQVDQALCAGCGVCVDDCPTGAISLLDGAALVDNALCNDCRVCITVCPNEALAWIAEPVAERVQEPTFLPVPRWPTQVIDVDTRNVVPWRQAVLPAVSGVLSWVGREVVPRMAPLALDVLDGALHRRLSRFPRNQSVSSAAPERRYGHGEQRRHRRRRRRW